MKCLSFDSCQKNNNSPVFFDKMFDSSFSACFPNGLDDAMLLRIGISDFLGERQIVPVWAANDVDVAVKFYDHICLNWH